VRIRRTVPGPGLPTGAAKAQWLAGFVTGMWEELDHLWSERAVDYVFA
jgi:streptomycin 6-kinase